MKYCQPDEKFWAEYQRRLEESDEKMLQKDLFTERNAKKRGRIRNAHKQRRYKRAA